MAKGGEEDAPSAEATTIPKEPSFEGRLQLKSFMFTKSANTTSPTMRRSPRLLSAAHQDATASPSRPPPPTQASPSKPKPKPPPSQKHKAPPPSSPTTTNKKRKRNSATTYAPPATYAHLPHLPDALAPNLLILFVGLNPGLQTARTGHAYAHPSNLFWRLLHGSGITPARCRADEDRTLPARFALGHTNIVARPTRRGDELSKGEMDDGVAVLEDKCRRFRPEVVCVVGKSIWESLVRVWRGRGLGRGEFEYGWQRERIGAVEEGGDGGDGQEEPWDGARIFVATSTSGLAASLRPEEKMRIWRILGDWCVRRRREREEEEEGEKGKSLGDVKEELEEGDESVRNA